MQRKILWGSLAVVGVILVIGGATLGVVRRDLVRRSQDELFRQAEATARLIELELNNADVTLREVPVNARRALEQNRLIGGHDYVEAAFVTNRIFRPINADPKLLPLLEGSNLSRGVFEVDVDGDPVSVAVQTFDLDQLTDQVPLRMVIAIGRRDPLLLPGTVTRPLVVAAVIGLALAVVLALVLSASVGRRLRGLERAAAAVAAGDAGARAPVSGGDEIASVASAFNAMAQQLEDGRRRERDFLMSVGHDLRTPLTTIRGYAEALDAGDVDPGDLPRVAGVVRAQTDRLSRLVEDLMLLSRLEAREFSLRPELVDLAAHLAGVIEAHERRAVAVGVRLEIDLADVGTIAVDPDRAAQVVGNLLDNALRYTPEGGRVDVTLSRNGDVCRLVVADSGPGIDPEDIPHVFDRLYVAQRYRPVRPEGSGLGLSIVHELVTAMRGAVNVTSTPGKGTAIAVDLPAG